MYCTTSMKQCLSCVPYMRSTTEKYRQWMKWWSEVKVIVSVIQMCKECSCVCVVYAYLHTYLSTSFWTSQADYQATSLHSYTTYTSSAVASIKNLLPINTYTSILHPCLKIVERAATCAATCAKTWPRALSVLSRTVCAASIVSWTSIL